jgi:5-methyltetrahydrofolate--homocysteine methyltransferase
LWGIGGPAREKGIAKRYISSIVAAQESAGADWLDLNIDEIAPESPTRAEAMAWLVGVVEEEAMIPIAIDSSDSEVVLRGVLASQRPSGRLLLNSASVERQEVLDLAKRHGCAVVLAASGRSGMPSDAHERVRNAVELVQIALAIGLSVGDLFVDPLVLPVAVDGSSALFVFEAAQQLRVEYGDAIHVIGGLSNVSFGLPERRLLNDTFIDLAAEAGIDSGILDPVASDLQRVFAADRDAPRYRLAREVLLGRDPFGVAYLSAFRKGELAAPS